MYTIARILVRKAKGSEMKKMRPVYLGVMVGLAGLTILVDKRDTSVHVNAVRQKLVSTVRGIRLPYFVTNPALAQSAKSSREPSPASMATRLMNRAPSGIGTSNLHAGESTRITGLAAAS